MVGPVDYLIASCEFKREVEQLLNQIIILHLLHDFYPSHLYCKKKKKNDFI